jgi:hypothetical protein
MTSLLMRKVLVGLFEVKPFIQIPAVSMCKYSFIFRMKYECLMAYYIPLLPCFIDVDENRQ